MFFFLPCDIYMLKCQSVNFLELQQKVNQNRFVGPVSKASVIRHAKAMRTVSTLSTTVRREA